MSVKEIRDILNELNEPNEYQLDEVDLVDDTTYYVWKVSNIKIKNPSSLKNSTKTKKLPFFQFIMVKLLYSIIFDFLIFSFYPW